MIGSADTGQVWHRLQGRSLNPFTNSVTRQKVGEEPAPRVRSNYTPCA